MVHPTPALINPLAFGIGHAGPAAVWCTRTRRFRPLTKPADADADLEQARASASAASTSAMAAKNGVAAGASGKVRTPLPLQKWTANKQPQPYTLPASLAQRQKQLNNIVPVVPPSTCANSSATPNGQTTRSSVPAPTVWWNDHLRMI